MPPFERWYGGSAKIISNLNSKEFRSSIQSPCSRVNLLSDDL